MSAERRKILFVCPRYPAPPRRGDQVRAYNLASAFADRAEVAMVSFGTDAEAAAAGVPGVSLRTVTPSPGGRLAANLRHPSPRLPGQVRLFLDTAMAAAVEEEIRRLRPDVVHVVLARMGPYLPAPGGGLHRHLDLTDSLALNMETRAGRSRGPLRPAFALEARLMRAYEAGLVARADSSSVVSALDRDVPGLARAAVVPNGVDLEAFSYRSPRVRPPVALFFGNLGYFHNVEPATVLARQMMPLLRRDGGGTLRIAGARPAAAVRELAGLAGVEVAADVADMPEQLHGAAVAVLPSFSGSGIKNKVLESFSAGLPVISNRLGMEGVAGAEAGRHYLAAETPAELAAATGTLLADGEARVALAERAHELIERHYTWSAQADSLERIYGWKEA